MGICVTFAVEHNCTGIPRGGLFHRVRVRGVPPKEEEASHGKVKHKWGTAYIETDDVRSGYEGGFRRRPVACFSIICRGKHGAVAARCQLASSSPAETHAVAPL